MNLTGLVGLVSNVLNVFFSESDNLKRNVSDWEPNVSEEWLRSTISAPEAPEVSKLLRKEQLSWLQKLHKPKLLVIGNTKIKKYFDFFQQKKQFF